MLWRWLSKLKFDQGSQESMEFLIPGFLHSCHLGFYLKVR